MPKNISFEDSLAQLRELVAKLESGECTLEESIKLFEQGTKLSNKCMEILSTAEKKISALTDGED